MIRKNGLELKILNQDPPQLKRKSNNIQEEALISFKNKVRNPYLHYNIKKITTKVAANKVKKINVNTQKVEELDIPAEENPVLRGFAKKIC